MKDGSILAKLPVMSTPLKIIIVPPNEAQIDIAHVNVTYKIEQYFFTGISCLQSPSEKANFSHIVGDWISSKVISCMKLDSMIVLICYT